MKGLFEHKLAITFANKETVLELNGCSIEAYHSNHLDTYRVLDNLMTGINQVLKICCRIVNKSRNVNNDNGHTVTITDNKTVLQALALINDCNKCKMDLTMNGIVITDAIKFVQTNKGKLAAAASAKEDNNGNESKESDFREYQVEQNQEEEDGEPSEQKTTNQVF
jgi:ribosomal protein L12E/L44/L45/RPP1/RPP2